MKAILIKREDGYNLGIEQPQGRLLEATCSPSQQLILDKSGASTKYKLSQENCDELFGVIDVEKLAEEDAKFKENFVIESSQVAPYRLGFRNGCNKAMELNKDKQFTLDDVRNAIQLARYHSTHNKNGILVCFHEDTDKIIQSLQQPTEIEVEIEMEAADLAFYENGKRYPIEANIPERFKYKPKLGSDGCLILKKL